MQVGLLWFDNDPHRDMALKIEDAVRRYREKFGVTPNTCYVNPSAFDEGMSDLGRAGKPMASLRVVPASNVLLHHFWVGVEELRDAP